MNLKQFTALMNLRFQLTKNQARKAGKVNYVISMIFIGIALLGSISAFVLGLIGGSLWFDGANIRNVIFTWNVIVGLFMFFWLVGLMAELQQTELLSLDKLLHLPMTLQGAFLLNYSSCFLNTSFILFVPGMIGLAVGMTIGNGFHMALSIPLILSFLFLVSALTYQVRGWLSKLLENKRNKGNAIAVMTVFFVALSQVPHLLTRNLSSDRKEQQAEIRVKLDEKLDAKMVGLEAEVAHGDLEFDHFTNLVALSQDEHLENYQNVRKQVKEKSRAATVQWVRTFDKYCPLGWLPLGITKLAEGDWLKPLLVVFSFTVAGILSLVLSYRSNMKRYMGEDSKRSKKKKKEVDTSRPIDFLHKKLPWGSPHVNSVALSSMQSLLRSPEAKMMLMLPIILILVFGSVIFGLWRKGDLGTMPSVVRPWIALSLVGGTMFTISSFMFNIFGMDRDGFRAYVLAPLTRSELLLGKNLSLLPIGMGIGLTLIILFQFLAPMGPLLFLAMVIQIPIIFIYYCMLGNYFSIGFPMGIKRGTMQPTDPKILKLIVISLTMMLGMTLALAPSSIAIGIPNLLEWYFEMPMGLLYCILSLAQLAASVWLYKKVLANQANWLWHRETTILLEVANVPE